MRQNNPRFCSSRCTTKSSIGRTTTEMLDLEERGGDPNPLIRHGLRCSAPSILSPRWMLWMELFVAVAILAHDRTKGAGLCSAFHFFAPQQRTNGKFSRAVELQSPPFEWTPLGRTFRCGKSHPRPTNVLLKIAVLQSQWDEIWNKKYELLVQFKEREGHTNVKGSHQEDGEKLGIWARAQRAKRRKGTLVKDRLDRLNDLGFEWNDTKSIDQSNEARWTQTYELLAKYKEREGHAHPPSYHREDGRNLGGWLAEQRTAKKEGNLVQHRVDRLNDLDIRWSIGGNSRSRWHDKWANMIAMLEKFKAREGHCEVPLYHIEDGACLGTWLNRQIIQKRKGALNKELEDRLTSIGVSWDFKRSTRNEKIFRLLEKYKKREGNLDIHFNHQEDGVKLGLWLSNKRTSKAKGTLSKEIEDKLVSMGVVWNKTEFKWEHSFKLYKQFIEREGHADIKLRHEEDGCRLGYWLAKQRERKKEGMLSEDEEEKLTSVGVVWDPMETRQNNFLSLLSKYKEREGHFDVPIRHKEDGASLGSWLQHTRTKCMNGTLDKDLQEKLTNLGFDLNRAGCVPWDEMYAMLVRFKDREGHCVVPRGHYENGQPLALWCKHQRRRKRMGQLEEDKITKLIEVDFAWNLYKKKWDEMYALLEQYIDREKTWEMRTNYKEDGNNLGLWLYKQRLKGKEGKLTPDRQQRLSSAGVVF